MYLGKKTNKNNQTSPSPHISRYFYSNMVVEMFPFEYICHHLICLFLIHHHGKGLQQCQIRFSSMTNRRCV